MYTVHTSRHCVRVLYLLFEDVTVRNDVDEEKKMVSFYIGSARVCINNKATIFQSSNANRHAVELEPLLRRVSREASSPYPVLFVMTNCGPDHNCKHLLDQMSWLCLFFKTGVDVLVVTRVAPTQS
jgi:hypothetical protein